MEKELKPTGLKLTVNEQSIELLYDKDEMIRFEVGYDNHEKKACWFSSRDLIDIIRDHTKKFINPTTESPGFL